MGFLCLALFVCFVSGFGFLVWGLFCVSEICQDVVGQAGACFYELFVYSSEKKKNPRILFD